MSPASELRTVRVFADLAEQDLDWLATTGRLVSYEPGDAIFREGEPADVMVAVIEGEVRAARETPPADGRVFVVGSGGVGAMLPFSRLKVFPLTGRATLPTRALLFPAPAFPEMLRRVPVLEARLVAAMADRVKENSREEQKRETLMALGKLSAGLAHELNNPAAAARRASSQLGERLTLLRQLSHPLLAACFGAEAFHAIDRLVTRAAQARKGPAPGPLERADREDELAEWLDRHGIDEPEPLAASFAERHLTVADLEAASAALPEEALASALAWAEALMTAQGLARDIDVATGRISDLVAAVKSYTHMDQTPAMVQTDVHESLETTLTVLAHKLREKGIVVSRSLAQDLPSIPAYPGELNQVWTNIIDNAADAAPRGGHVAVRTALDESCVLVAIEDDGTGIAPEDLTRIFEPFFTTKPVGEGTGLGLDIAHRIVTRRHAGEIRVDSRPGATRFEIRLPLKAAARV